MNKALLQSLDPDSEKLNNLAKDFQDILDSGNLKVCSLLESSGKIGLPVFNGKVSKWLAFDGYTLNLIGSTRLVRVVRVTVV